MWDHLNGTDSAPFEANEDTKIAVKVIDQRGNELMVVKTIGEAAR
jgi:adenine-specific DNA-methyltransferase